MTGKEKARQSLERLRAMFNAKQRAKNRTDLPMIDRHIQQFAAALAQQTPAGTAR